MERWSALGLVLLPFVLILAVSGVIMLRPLTKRLGDLLEMMYEDRQLGPGGPIDEVLRRLDSIEGRMTRLEGEKVLGSGGERGDRESLPSPSEEELPGA